MDFIQKKSKLAQSGSAILNRFTPRYKIGNDQKGAVTVVF
jgi:hypothetical protein